MSDDGKIMRLVPNAPKPVPADAIAMLEDIIDRLRSGTVTDVAVAATDVKTHELHTAWFGWSGHLIAPTQLLAARLMTDLRGQ